MSIEVVARDDRISEIGSGEIAPVALVIRPIEPELEDKLETFRGAVSDDAVRADEPKTEGTCIFTTISG